jgi:SAM-dependent methyltransferase
MDEEELLLAAKVELVAAYGPWTAANIRLADGVYTIDGAAPVAHAGVQRYGQLISDLTRRPFAELRILDLACLEAEYAIEFARQGAEVVAIEGRAGNVAKARFAKDALGLAKLRIEHDDVRNLSREKHGLFDAVLCSGILYHLDAPDFVQLLERIAEVCTGCAIVDTHVSPDAGEHFDYKGHRYWGRRFVEHHAKATAAEREASLWASLDNPTSFWPTRASLYNALLASGFTSVSECHAPARPGREAHRVTLAAIRGAPFRSVDGGSFPVSEIPETPATDPWAPWRRRARHLALQMPHPLLRLLRRLRR